MKFIGLVLVLCAAGFHPTLSVSRWLSATFYDLKFTLYRYSHCASDLGPLHEFGLSESEYLVRQVSNFLEQANYNNEQLANVSALMDNICRSDMDQSYPISVHIDVNAFGNNHSRGKQNRCQAIDDALDAMFHVLKRAALNRSEPLDFSSIRFFPDANDRSAFYNLTDLINTSWIKSETVLEHVCSITDSIKRHVQARQTAGSPSATTTTATADRRNEQLPRVGLFTALFDLIDRLLDPLLGFQKRLAWEGGTRLEIVASRVSSGISSIGAGLGRGFKSTREQLSSLFLASPTAKDATNSSSVRPQPSHSLAGSANVNLVTKPPMSSDAEASKSAQLGANSTSTTTVIYETNKPTTSKPLTASTLVVNPV